MARLGCVALFGIALFLSGAADAYAARKFALVIGNDVYPTLSADQQLKKAVNDADTMGDLLARLGFEVIRGKNLGRQAIIDKLADFTSQIGSQDTALFFYAGHGVSIGGVNYLVPVDVPKLSGAAESRLRGAAISEPDVIAEIQARNPRVSVMVLDACRDNPFPRVGTRSVGLARGLAEPTQGRGIFTFYSAGIGQSALDRLQQDDRDRNSVFTRVLVEYLAKPGMHLGEIAIEVRERVAALALRARDEQGSPLPHEQTPAYYDQTRGGRIYLAGLPAAGPPARSPSIDATPPAAAVDPAQIAFDHAKSVGTVEAMEAFTQLFKSGPLVDRANDEIYKLTTKRVASVIEVSRDALFRSRAQVTLGNPDGDVTLVQFLDYNCEHCRRAVEDLTTLLKTDPGLRVVLKDLPILGPASTDVGRIAIALAMHDASGKRYFNFHQKMYASRGKIDRARALSVVSEVGADRARVEKESAGSAVSDMLKENLKLAQDLGIHGTPSYLVNDQLIVGAVGLAELRKSIGYARCGKPTC